MEGLKFNWTAKEKAIKQLDQEQKEKESVVAYQNVMSELGLEII